MLYVIEFAPPMSGLEGEFNTFRLGGAWAKRTIPGERLLLIDKKQSAVLGWGLVSAVHVGTLTEMSALHGSRNHNQKGLDPEGAGERVIAAMKKRYGPHKVNDNSKVTVIELKRIE